MPANADKPGSPLSIIVVGASGDLARKKILPALFALYCRKYLPETFHIFGFARTELSHEAFRKALSESLTCRYCPPQRCDQLMASFLEHCFYVPGRYDSPDSFLDLYQAMKPLEAVHHANRLYYLAIPPSVFIHAARSMGQAGLVSCVPGETWSRVIIEKPFGSDRPSSDEMAEELSKAFPERDVYRIDHYLGKEVVQNLMVLRFANTIFEPLWNREHIESVQITWKEDIGIAARGGYFDQYGIIRDVMQNHLLQILSLVAMEEPAALNAQAVRDEKVRVLRCMPPLGWDDIAVGQYEAGPGAPAGSRSYRAETGIAPDSITPTYAAAALRVNNPRWEGVPFLMRAGKGLDSRVNEIHIQFRPRSRNLFRDLLPDLPPNDLVIRVQPDEAIFFRTVNKSPGLRLALTSAELDLQYKTAFDETIPDAYECLILDALRGDKSLFIRNDELAAAWDIFTPVLHELEKRHARPEPYAFGSAGPAAADQLAASRKVHWL